MHATRCSALHALNCTRNHGIICADRAVLVIEELKTQIGLYDIGPPVALSVLRRTTNLIDHDLLIYRRSRDICIALGALGTAYSGGKSTGQYRTFATDIQSL